MEICYANVSSTARVRLSWQEPGATGFAAIPSTQLQPEPTFGAPATTLSFDTIAVGTYLTNQLATSHGLTFATRTSFGGLYYSRPRVTNSTVATASAPRVLRNESWDPVEAMEISGDVPLTVSFSQPQSHVSLSAGAEEPVFPNPPAILRAFNGSGALVAAHVINPVPTTITGRLHVLRGAADIRTISVDFGASYRDERIDGLQFEAFTSVPPTPDLEPPIITFVEPTEGEVVQAGGVPVVLRVHEGSGLLDSLTLTAGGITSTPGLDPRVDPACAAPICQQFRTNVSLPNGTHTLVATAVDGAGITSTASRTVTFTGATLIRVQDEAGAPLPNAELFINGRVHPVPLDADGEVRLVPPLPSGTQLVARVRIHEQDYYRGNHATGSDHNWNYRVYRTSVTIRDDGTQDFHAITTPSVDQVLTVRQGNVLFGLHWTASLDWDAMGSDFDRVKERITDASKFLYNATDGQFFVEQAELTDYLHQWNDVDMRVLANTALRAHVNWPRGGFLGNNLLSTSYMHLSRLDSGATLAHEFGHYGLDLGDEYRDNDPSVMCSGQLGTTHPAFASFMPQASCMMFNQGAAAKLCSGHPDNPHVLGTRQGDDSCWRKLISRWENPNWRMKSPDTRGAVVGTVSIPVPGPDLVDWAPRFSIDNRGEPVVCAPRSIRVTDRGGTAITGAMVYLNHGSRWVKQGVTDLNGDVQLVGVHEGDVVYAFGSGMDTWGDGNSDSSPPGSGLTRIARVSCY